MTSSAGIAIEHVGVHVVAHVSGEVDVTNVERIGGDLVDSVSNDAAGLVIDLAGTRYLDSAAIEMLFETARRLRRRRQDVALVVPAASPLHPVFELVGIASAAAVCETIEEAIRAR